MARAIEKGIMSGYADNKFKPGKAVTREEMASILVRALGLQSEAIAKNNRWQNFDAFGEVQGWARGAVVVVAVEKGLIKGYKNNHFELRG